MQRQREAQPLNFIVRDLTPADLARLGPDTPRTDLSTPKVFRDTHHRIARLVASGLRLTEVAQRTGFSYGRVSILNASPAFQELVALYREKVLEAYTEQEQEFLEDATRVRNKALRHVEEAIDRADEAEELIPIKTALAVVEFAADRTGFGKQSTKLNINADFAKALEKAYSAQARVIESRAVPPSRDLPDSSQSPASKVPAVTGPAAPLGPPAGPPSSAPRALEALPRAPVAGVPVERGAGRITEPLRRRA